MIVFNQPAVILDMKQSQPKRLLPTSPERFVVSLQEKPNRGIYHRKTESTTPRVVGVYSTKFNTRFVVPLLLLHKKKKKKQEAESFHWTLRSCWLLSVLSEKPKRRASDLSVVMCVSWRCVRRWRRVGFDSPALHVRDELVRDLC